MLFICFEFYQVQFIIVGPSGQHILYHWHFGFRNFFHRILRGTYTILLNSKKMNIIYKYWTPCMRVRLISYFDAFAGRVTRGERICWFTCHGFYPDWCISSGAKLLRFKYAFIIWCRVLLLLISHNTRHASDVLHQSLYTLHTNTHNNRTHMRVSFVSFALYFPTSGTSWYVQFTSKRFVKISWIYLLEVRKKG